MSSKVNIYEVEEYEFDKLLQKERVLVMFGAIWCPHCRAMQSALEEVKEAHPEIYVARADADRAPALAARFSVRGLPTTLYFEKGEEKGRLVGFRRRAELEEMLKAHAMRDKIPDPVP